MKTLITGATGFIGKHLVRTLVEQGRDVRCLVRKTSDTQYLKKLGVELFYGDLLNRDSLKNIVKGVNIVHHLAGEVYSPRSGNYFKINVEGTKNLLEACLPEHIEKFIFLSSIQAVGPNKNQAILLNEKSPCMPITPYGKSKLKAEQFLREFYANDSSPVIIIRAPLVYGPGAANCRSAILFQTIRNGRFMFVGRRDHMLSTCYIDNLIRGMLLLEKSKKSVGKIYFIADSKPYTVKHMTRTIAEALSVKQPRIHIPVWTAYLIAALLFLPNKIFHFSRILSWNTIREVTHNWECDISLIKEEQEYKPIVEFEKGVSKTVASYMNRKI